MKKIIRYNKNNGILRNYELVIEGRIKGQNGFGLNFEEYSSSDVIYLDFFSGNSIYLYKKDIKRLLKYLELKLKDMK